MKDLQLAFLYLRARIEMAKRDERGSAVEWLVIVVAAVALCGVAYVFIHNYIENKGNDLNNQNTTP